MRSMVKGSGRDIIILPVSKNVKKKQECAAEA